MRHLKWGSTKGTYRGESFLSPVNRAPGQIVQRSLVPLRPLESLSQECRHSFERLDHACHQLGRLGNASFDELALWAKCVDTLPDELSLRATLQNGVPFHDAARSTAEFNAVDRHATTMLPACRDPNTFAEWLVAVAATGGVPKPKIRRQPIRLESDGNGIAVVFPPFK